MWRILVQLGRMPQVVSCGSRFVRSAQGWSSRFPPTSSYTVGKAEKVDFGELFAGEGLHQREHVPPHFWLDGCQFVE